MRTASLRARLAYVAGVFLILSSVVNLWHFNSYVANLPSRESDHRVIWENRLSGIRNALKMAGYNSGNIGYMPAGVLKGKPRTEREDVDWVQVRYAMIPLNVLQDSLDAPFVIAESTQAVEGFTTLYDGRNGWVLLQKKTAQ